MFGSRPFGGVCITYPCCESRYVALAAAPATPLPFSTVTDTFDGGSAFCFTFCLIPSAAAVAAFDEPTSGFTKFSTDDWRSDELTVQVFWHCTFSILSWK